MFELSVAFRDLDSQCIDLAQAVLEAWRVGLMGQLAQAAELCSGDQLLVESAGQHLRQQSLLIVLAVPVKIAERRR